MEGRYVFAVRFRLEPSADVELRPDEFETRLVRPAEEPGEDGWLFFRDNLWRGELADEDHFRDLTEEALGVPVTSASFSELRADDAYLEAFRTEIGRNLDAFNADSVEDAVSKYLGSSIRVVSDVE